MRQRAINLSVIVYPQEKAGGVKEKRRPFLLRRNIKNKANHLEGAVNASTLGPNGLMALESSAVAAIGSMKGNGEEGKVAAAAAALLMNKGGEEKNISGGAATTTASTGPRSDYQIVDNTEVKLNMNSYKMVWVTNKHGLFYKRNSISKARKVSDSQRPVDWPTSNNNSLHCRTIRR